MKLPCFLAILLLLVIATNGHAHQTPSWSPDHIKEIRLKINTKEVKVIKNIKDIDTFARCLSRADTIVEITFWSLIFGYKKYEEGKYKFNSTIVVIGDIPERAESGAWMYDSVQGIFSYLDPIMQSIYKLKEYDREAINEFLYKEQ